MIRMLDVQELLQQLQGLLELSMISHELRSLDLELRGMMGYQRVFRQQGCDHDLQIGVLDDELLQVQDDKQHYPNDVPKEA